MADSSNIRNFGKILQSFVIGRISILALFIVVVTVNIWIGENKLIKAFDQTPLGGIIEDSASIDALLSLNSPYDTIMPSLVENGEEASGLILPEGDTIGGVVDPNIPKPPPSKSTSAISSSAVNPWQVQTSHYFIRPTTGRRSRGIHRMNAVDIANECGTPVWAAASGIVIQAVTGGWNGGYGNFIRISHPNGMQTLYAHLRDILVTVGAPVAQGEPIATIGRTGNSTGCHLHFEVRWLDGRLPHPQNPF